MSQHKQQGQEDHGYSKQNWEYHQQTEAVTCWLHNCKNTSRRSELRILHTSDSEDSDQPALTRNVTPLAPVEGVLTNITQTGPHPHPVGLAGVYVHHRVRQLL